MSFFCQLRDFCIETQRIRYRGITMSPRLNRPNLIPHFPMLSHPNLHSEGSVHQCYCREGTNMLACRILKNIQRAVELKTRPDEQSFDCVITPTPLLLWQDFLYPLPFKSSFSRDIPLVDLEITTFHARSFLSPN
jgi:hypothetical protein